MSERNYFIRLNHDTAIHVWFETYRGKVRRFAVKLIHHGTEIVRYDSGHGCPHKDILHPNPHKKRKVWYPNLDNDTVLTLAITELKAEYQLYIERYMRWLEEERPKSKE